MTADELLRYRHEPYRQELLAGTLHEMEPPGAEHGIVAMRIGAMLANHVDAADLGLAFAAETGFRLASDPDTVRAPDAAFVARERADAVGRPTGYWPGAPDLAIEVVSPHDRHSAVEGKALDWLDAGARAVVVLDPPRRTATVYRTRADIRVLEGDERLELGDVVPGWAPSIASFFA
ncbi:MAG TPA: Uma2 family endonuclease [Solirubrobacteraceae bacterium]|nr:Uma2 family endonuclease [Solirubrobacteraceae bacterium]